MDCPYGANFSQRVRRDSEIIWTKWLEANKSRPNVVGFAQLLVELIEGQMGQPSKHVRSVAQGALDAARRRFPVSDSEVLEVAAKLETCWQYGMGFASWLRKQRPKKK